MVLSAVTCRSACAHLRKKLVGCRFSLGRLTLRYSKKSEEFGFLHHSSKRLVSVWPWIMLTYVLVMLSGRVHDARNVAWDWLYDTSSARFGPEMFFWCSRMIGIFVALFLVAACNSQWVLQRVDGILMERVVIVSLLYSMMMCADRYYILRMVGHSDPQSLYALSELPSAYSDSSLLMKLCLLLLASHVCVPVRWCSLLWIELALPIFYGALSYSWGAEEDHRKLSLNMYLLALVFLASFGKRQLEINERTIFSALLSEKMLRVQAEFNLSQTEKSQVLDDVRSIPETTCTGEVFAGLHSPETSPSSLQVLFNIGKAEQWIIDEKELSVNPNAILGKGGFSLVLAGEFQSSPVAIKIQKTTASGMRNFVDIGNELRLLRKIRHRNIVCLHGACLSLKHKDIALVMEIVFGESMERFIPGQPSTAHRRQVLIGITRGMIYLHTRRPVIYHGDLKPANVMVDRIGNDFQAKILDFGLARLITHNASPGGGTYRWMAPEVLGSCDRPSMMADVFSLGLIIFFACTGEKPFAELGAQELKARIKHRTHFALSWTDELSPFAKQCKPLVDLATQQSPSDRPSMHEIYRGLMQLDESSSSVLSCQLDVGEQPDVCKIGIDHGDLWQTLSLARHAVYAKEADEQDSVLRRWSNMNHFLVSPPLSLKAGTEQIAAKTAIDRQAGDSGPAMVHPTLVATPKKCMALSVLATISHWNSAMPHEACCEYHAALAQLADISKFLQRRACSPLMTWTASSSFRQCSACFMVAPSDVRPPTGCPVFCKFCGFEGTPLAEVHEEGQSMHKTGNSSEDCKQPLRVEL